MAKIPWEKMHLYTCCESYSKQAVEIFNKNIIKQAIEIFDESIFPHHS